MRSSRISLSWRLLPIQVHPFEDDRRQLKRDLKDIRRRDAEDALAPALARSLKLPIWSNDRDLALPGMRCYPTAALLKRFDRV